MDVARISVSRRSPSPNRKPIQQSHPVPGPRYSYHRLHPDNQGSLAGSAPGPSVPGPDTAQPPVVDSAQSHQHEDKARIRTQLSEHSTGSFQVDESDFDGKYGCL